MTMIGAYDYLADYAPSLIAEDFEQGFIIIKQDGTAYASYAKRVTTETVVVDYPLFGLKMFAEQGDAYEWLRGFMDGEDVYEYSAENDDFVGIPKVVIDMRVERVRFALSSQTAEEVINPRNYQELGLSVEEIEFSVPLVQQAIVDTWDAYARGRNVARAYDAQAETA